MTPSLQGDAPDSPDQTALVKAQALALELRSLQDQLNSTIDQLCELVAGQPADTLHRPAQERFVPEWLRWPQPTACFNNPPSGLALGAHTVFYTNARGGLWQLIQQPLARHRGIGYALSVNYTQFDGEWMSLVFDASALLRGQPAGKVTLDLTTEVTGSPLENLSVRCVWTGVNHSGELPFDVQLNRVGRLQAELEYLDPALTRSFEVHWVLSVPARGALELQRLSLNLSIIPAGEPSTAALSDVFEL